MGKNHEIEIKIRIDGTKEIIEKLRSLRAKDLGVYEQEDILFDYAEEGKTFGTYDQAFRLRIAKSDVDEYALLTFKGTPHVEKDGKKIREEYNVPVEDPKALLKILQNIGFKEALRVKKRRHEFELDGLEITVDELPFGNFLEIEGEKEDIDKMVKKLGVENNTVETEPYFKLQLKHEA